GGLGGGATNTFTRPPPPPGGHPGVGLPGPAPVNPPGGGTTPALAGGNCSPCTTWVGLTHGDGTPYTGQWIILPRNTPCPDGWRGAGLDCDFNTLCTPIGADAYSTFGPSGAPGCATPPPTTPGPVWCVISNGCLVTTTDNPNYQPGPTETLKGPYTDAYTASVACNVGCVPTNGPPPSPPPPFPPPPPVVPPPVVIQPPP